ncbi:protein penguin [Drosophila nasuta]|uniref:protein penguin n=1 Tax=Drosophila nasuta TaxID=42062 RepID=UPI00295E9F27|nr:protein penguin [Drosophila nasuta]
MDNEILIQLLGCVDAAIAKEIEKQCGKLEKSTQTEELPSPEQEISVVNMVVRATDKKEKSTKDADKLAQKRKATDSAKRNNKFADRNQKGKNTAANGTSTEKTDWNKFKKEKKELKLKRKQTRDTYEVTVEVKKIYEQLKCNATKNKDTLVQQMYKLLNVSADNINKVAKAHDTARILQCMIKFGSPALRVELSDKLMPDAVTMCQSKYSHFCIQAMLKYCTSATKSKLADALMGNLVRLAGHNIAGKLVDDIYQAATKQQRCHMRQEFYGELYKKNKDSNVTTLSDTYKDASNMKASIMGAVKTNIEHLANKKLLDSSLVHDVIIEYLKASENLAEIAVTLAASLPQLLSTKAGTEASTLCFYASEPKTRRAILKNIKEHLLKIALHEHGHVFLISLFNVLDDTKAAKKSVYDPLHGDLKTLVASPHGRRVIQWLIAPGDTVCFHPTFIKFIDDGLVHSKKDKEVRRKELLEQIEEPIALAMCEDPGFWLSNSSVGLVTITILKHITGEHYNKAAAALAPIVAAADWRITPLPADSEQQTQSKDTEAIIAAATEQRKNKKKKVSIVPAAEKPESDDDENDDDDTGEPKQTKKPKLDTKSAEPATELGIENSGMHHVLKTIIKQDLKCDGTPFSAKLLESLTPEVLTGWFPINRACYVLVTLVEKTPDLQQQLLKFFDSQTLRDLLLQQKSSGASILAKKLELAGK